MSWRSWKSAPPDAGEDDPQAEPAAAGAEGVEGIEDAEDTGEPPAFPPPLPLQLQFFGRPHPRTGQPRGLPEVDEPVPDTVLDQADFDGLTVRAASIRGDDHRWYGGPRQDSMGLWALPRAGAQDVLLACVADGVGSEQLSHVGSTLACRLLRRELAAYAEGAVDPGDEADLRDLGQRICDRVRLGMLEHAEVLAPDPRALSTTLVAAVIELAPPGRPRRCVLLRVGDSSAYLLRDGAFRDCLADPHGEETIVNSATAALPTRPAAVEVAEVAIGNDDVLLLCSDGLANPMRGPEVREKLVDYWSGPIPGALEFGWQLSFRAKSYGDDRTAICVWGR